VSASVALAGTTDPVIGRRGGSADPVLVGDRLADGPGVGI